ncbi:MAG: SiaB family protein kinase [Campylobacterota bacterium]|nr:SiaB family protein kinase [Campylobacterota bacterium]
MKFDALESILEQDGIVFLSYGGCLTQSLIAGMTDALEHEAQNNELSIKISGNIFTIFIELAQNMMNYSKSKQDANHTYESKGLVLVGMEPDKKSYYIMSRNQIDADDKIKVEKRLKEVEGLNKDQLRSLYREQRKAGKDKHAKGAGIGFIEIARRCDKIEYDFTPSSENRYFFTLKTIINKN